MLMIRIPIQWHSQCCYTPDTPRAAAAEGEGTKGSQRDANHTEGCKEHWIRIPVHTAKTLLPHTPHCRLEPRQYVGPYILPPAPISDWTSLPVAVEHRLLFLSRASGWSAVVFSPASRRVRPVIHQAATSLATWHCRLQSRTCCFHTHTNAP